MVGKLHGHRQLQTTILYAHLAENRANCAAEENANRLSADLNTEGRAKPQLRTVTLGCA